jgi:hypothetical protein
MMMLLVCDPFSVLLAFFLYIHPPFIISTLLYVISFAFSV